MLDTAFQEDIPLQMFVYPANANAELPELFVQLPGRPPALLCCRLTPSRPAATLDQRLDGSDAALTTPNHQAGRVHSPRRECQSLPNKARHAQTHPTDLYPGRHSALFLAFFFFILRQHPARSFTGNRRAGWRHR